MDENKGSVRLAWRDIAIWSIILCVALVAVTSVVATVKDVDTLSVVALALAVIAFVAQIIVFIVQAAAANDQQIKAQDVYAQTMKALTLIEEKMEGTRRTVNTMSEQLLARVLSGSLPESVAKEAIAGGVGDPPPIEQSRSTPRQRPAGRVGARNTSGVSGNRLVYLPPEKDEAKNKEIVEFMQRFPTGDDMEAAREALSDMTLQETHTLLLLAEDEIHSRRPGSSLGPGLGVLDEARASRLFDKGLIRQVRVPKEPNKAVFVLTDAGRNVARVFTGTGSPPPNYPRELLDLAQNTRDYQKQVRERRHSINPNIPLDEL
ncbi:hypothetical protein GA0070622_0728 [Micromonospora sediminicola]|uniref:Uncharacterized protein n=1 Tax=Micromonospora sediminicola TaxID=946078 RepID=A0A1A9B3R6_9ACTN|nr:hypothetical protein [Micromonospora sediminicola]SBT63763.1 hypothetical protein GA0070622_0728 [Micromonospora sediminicola]